LLLLSVSRVGLVVVFFFAFGEGFENDWDLGAVG
jgi:hypothetical protein